MAASHIKVLHQVIFSNPINLRSLRDTPCRRPVFFIEEYVLFTDKLSITLYLKLHDFRSHLVFFYFVTFTLVVVLSILLVYIGDIHALCYHKLTGFNDINELRKFFVFNEESFAAGVLDFYEVFDHLLLGWLSELAKHIAVL